MSVTADYAPTRDLAGLRSAWMHLSDAMGTQDFFLRWEWRWAVHEHLFPEQITYHCFYAGGELAAVFPMLDVARVGSPLFGYRVLPAPAHSEIFLDDAVVHPEHVGAVGEMLARLSGAVAPGPDVVRYAHVPEWGSLARHVQPTRGTVRRVVDGGSAHCERTDRGFLDRLSSKHLQNVRRLGKKAQREFGPRGAGLLRRTGCPRRGLRPLRADRGRELEGSGRGRDQLSLPTRSPELLPGRAERVRRQRAR